MLPFQSHADDIEDIEANLVQSREVHEDALKEVREDVSTQIDAAVAAEKKRDNPNIERIESLLADRKALEEGSFPRWIDSKHKKKIIDANRKLVASLIETKAAYVRAEEFEKAKAIDEEVREITGPVVRRTPPSRLLGSWNGVLNIDGQSLRLIFRVRQSPRNGALEAALDSLDQGVKDIPVSSILVLEDGTVTFEVEKIGGTFTGRFDTARKLSRWRVVTRST